MAMRRSPLQRGRQHAGAGARVGLGSEGAGSAGIPVWGVAESGTGQNSRRQAHSLRAARGAHSPSEGDVAGSAPSCLPRLAPLCGWASWALTRHTGPALDLGLRCRGADGEKQLPVDCVAGSPVACALGSLKAAGWDAIQTCQGIARVRDSQGRGGPLGRALVQGQDSCPGGVSARTQSRSWGDPRKRRDHPFNLPQHSCPRARAPPTDGCLLARPELLKPPAIVADPPHAEVFLVLGGKLPPPFSPGSSWSLEPQR